MILMNNEIDKFIYDSRIRSEEIDFIEKLIKLRYDFHLSQRELALRTNIRQPVIARLETLTNSPNLNTIVKILDFYGYTLDIKKKK